MSKIKSFQQDYKQDGYVVLKNSIETRLLQELEQDFYSLLQMQYKKLTKNECPRDIDSLSLALNKLNSKAFKEAAAMLRNTASGHLLAGYSNIRETCENILGSKQLLFSGPSLFVNFPENNTGKYTWHAEQIWYPKRRNFVNIWIPFVHNRPAGQSMDILKGTHQKDWFYFSEYTGYSDYDNNANVQYEIPESMLNGYERHSIDLAIGDMIIFSPKLVHRSIDNPNNKPLYAFTIRVFDFTNDLTLSSNWADLPYSSRASGAPNILVE